VARQGDITDIGLADGTFDLAWSSHTLHILQDPLVGLRELARVTKPGGWIAVREDQHAPRLMPSDLGVGEPGLEERIATAFQRWYSADRMQRGRMPFGWAAALQRVGLRNVRTQCFLFEVPQPFDPAQVAHLRSWLRRRADTVGLTTADRDLLLKLAQEGTDDDLFNRTDLHFTDVATLYLGSTSA
jgi:SAM-dependent methyltransferase